MEIEVEGFLIGDHQVEGTEVEGQEVDIPLEVDRLLVDQGGQELVGLTETQGEMQIDHLREDLQAHIFQLQDTSKQTKIQIGNPCAILLSNLIFVLAIGSYVCAMFCAIIA